MSVLRFCRRCVGARSGWSTRCFVRTTSALTLKRRSITNPLPKRVARLAGVHQTGPTRPTWRNPPVIVLGPPRSGALVVADIVAAATGGVSHTYKVDGHRSAASTPTAAEITDAHREMLFQLGSDNTCPPTRISDAADVTALESAVVETAHSDALAVFGEPALLHLLSAWRRAGVDRAHLIGVVRSPAEATLALEQRDGLRFAHAHDLVELALERLRMVATDQPLPIIRFAHDSDVGGAVVEVVGAWGIDVDPTAAHEAFRPDLISRRAPVGCTTPAFDRAIAAARASRGPGAVPETPRVDEYASLPRHCGERFQLQRNALCEAFEIDPRAVVAEVVPTGARPMTAERSVGAHHVVIEIAGFAGLASALAGQLRRPDVIIAPGLLDGVGPDDVERVLGIAATTSFPFCDLILDVSGDLPLAFTADRRWRIATTQPLSEGRVAVRLTKFPHDEIAVIGEQVRTLEDLVDRIVDAWAAERTAHEEQLANVGFEMRRERRRADRAEDDIERLRQRRSVRAVLAVSRAASPIIRWSTRATVGRSDT